MSYNCVVTFVITINYLSRKYYICFSKVNTEEIFVKWINKAIQEQEKCFICFQLWSSESSKIPLSTMLIDTPRATWTKDTTESGRTTSLYQPLNLSTGWRWSPEAIEHPCDKCFKQQNFLEEILHSNLLPLFNSHDMSRGSLLYH